MFLPIPTQKSCARAWVAAASTIAEQGKAYNVIIDVDSPAEYDAMDHRIIGHLDKFLREADQNPVSTVANTIFPQAIYEKYGAPEFFGEYLRVYDSLSKPGWGRYFERMTRHNKLDGETYNPLATMIERLHDRKDAQRYTSAYELAIYDPLRDGRVFRGGQCLSFLSFKLHPERGVCLTAMYRNHTYITRCLGNLIGLGRLLAFVAAESGFDVGTLTCISTHAEIDVCSKKWNLTQARDLIREAGQIMNESSQSQVSKRAVR